MAIRLPEESLDDADERKSLDLESSPDSKTPKWLRGARPNRRGLIIAGVLTIMIPAILLALPYYGINPISYISLPSERPSDMSMCDYYAQKNYYWNSASTQKKLVKSIIDKAFVGAKDPEKYFGSKSGMYNGILRPGDWIEIPCDLTKYFDGSSNTTNVNGKATRVNFFSGRNFTQYGRDYPEGNSLFNHMKQGMYRYTAPMLGCSIYGNTVDKYSGTRTMKEIHKFMKLDDIKNWDWMYFIHQLQLGAAAAKFSETDAGLFEAYLVDIFGPRFEMQADKKKKWVPSFQNPVLEKSIIPPKFDEKIIFAHKHEIISVMAPEYRWKRSDAHANGKRDVHHHLHRRQDFSTPPPPLTTPDFAGPTGTSSVSAPSEESTSEGVPSNVLPIALGAGIGAGLGVIIIGIAIGYLVVRKRRLAKRQSVPAMGLKPGMIEMQLGDSAPSTAAPTTPPAPIPSKRVDRSEGGNVVGKPKHKKNVSVGERSVRFSQS
ncbi:hypothetical protein ABW19_dt0203752 [Dactylella cylindrospora]|nr:hypothetical protein ABW19_dt0203752 [Dactylella cylindrospora]